MCRLQDSAIVFAMVVLAAFAVATIASLMSGQTPPGERSGLAFAAGMLLLVVVGLGLVLRRSVEG